MYSTIDVDVFELLDNLSDGEAERVVEYLTGGSDRVTWTDDPVNRLVIISELRSAGYTVEPA